MMSDALQLTEDLAKEKKAAVSDLQKSRGKCNGYHTALKNAKEKFNKADGIAAAVFTPPGFVVEALASARNFPQPIVTKVAQHL